MSKFTPGLSTEHPGSKQRALHDLSSQQWLITLIVYRMSEGQSNVISLETVYEEARKFNEEVIWALNYCDNIANIHLKLAKNAIFANTPPLAALIYSPGERAVRAKLPGQAPEAAEGRAARPRRPRAQLLRGRYWAQHREYRYH